MAVNFDSYLDVEVDTIERPLPPPIGHYFATIKSWKTAERAYDKESGVKTPVVQIDFALTSPDTDVDESMLPEKGVANRVVNNDYTLNEPMGIFQLRQLAEETCKLPVKGLKLSDMLPMLIGQPVKLYLDQRAGKGSTEGQFFPQVKKVLPAE